MKHGLNAEIACYGGNEAIEQEETEGTEEEHTLALRFLCCLLLVNHCHFFDILSVHNLHHPCFVRVHPWLRTLLSRLHNFALVVFGAFARLYKQRGDDFFQRRVFNAHVFHRVIGQYAG
jgi:hypothetical protein